MHPSENNPANKQCAAQNGYSDGLGHTTDSDYSKRLSRESDDTSLENRDSGGGPVDHEPDYRFTLANERTFLAWIRTALALMAGSVAIIHLVPDFAIPELRKLLGGMLAMIGLAVVAGSSLRWRSAYLAMRRDDPLPSTLMPWLLALGIILVGLLVLVLALMFGIGDA